MSKDIAISKALGAHGLWVSRFRNMIAGSEKIDPAVAGRDDQCEFGKWMRGEGPRLLAGPEFAELNRLHAEFHRVAGALATKVQRGDLASANASMAMGGDFSKASAALSRALIKAKDQAA